MPLGEEERSEGWLVAESLLVEVITDKANREDDDGEEVAAIVRVSSEGLGESLVVVLCLALEYLVGLSESWRGTLTGSYARKSSVLL